MSVEASDDSGAGLDLAPLAELASFALDRLRIHPDSELGLTAVDESAMTDLNGKWMGQDGPTDVLAFPIDELRAPLPGAEPEPGVLGDVVLCPQVADRQGVEAGHGAVAELELLTVHGILHLLGHDHAEPDEHRVMFGLQDELLAAWRSGPPGSTPSEELDRA